MESCKKHECYLVEIASVKNNKCSYHNSKTMKEEREGYNTGFLTSVLSFNGWL